MKDTTFELFGNLAGDHAVVPVFRTLFAESETPIGIYRKLSQGRPGSFLLESAEQGGIWSRYSFVGVSSYGTLSEHDGRAVWIDDGESQSISQEIAFGQTSDLSPLEAVSKLHEMWSSPAIAGLPPLMGGLVGFIGWDTVRQIESLNNSPASDHDLPIQSLCFVRELVVIDHLLGEVVLVVNALPKVQGDGESCWANAQASLDAMQAALAKPAEAWVARLDYDASSEAAPRIDEAAFISAVEKAKVHIGNGDIFQVVLSQRFDAKIETEPLDVYRVLRALNPSPYMYFLSFVGPDGKPFWIVGSSPEALVKVNNGRVITHPIAGSMPRGATPELDIELATELVQNQKERAEHLMLVDLARNDLLKVCRPGTVEVTEFMQVERFSHIMHLVSSVEGELLKDAQPVDVFKATFPAGTLSGAPKPRALEIIDALEPTARGVYGGVVGYLGFSGDLDLAIAIRTAVIVDGIAMVQAGAGIVADSDPKVEFQETLNKAAAPLRAIAIANSAIRV
ncbi:MAG: anthranilate synthase component I [Cryobacterium sp.]|nr:anthranilate synthase component I [Cryobacterium sp.]